MTTSLIIAAVGIAIPFTSLGAFLGFTRLQPTYWIGLLLILLSYAVLTHVTKTWFVRRFGLD
jgi:Mg2+-importing ATPase